MNVITIRRTTRPARPYLNSSKRRSIREISRIYFKREHASSFAMELLLFLILAGISAWPIVVALQVLNQFLQTSAA